MLLCYKLSVCLIQFMRSNLWSQAPALDSCLAWPMAPPAGLLRLNQCSLCLPAVLPSSDQQR